MQKRIRILLVLAVTVPMLCSSAGRPDGHRPRPRESGSEPFFTLPAKYAMLTAEMAHKHGVPLWLASRLVAAESTDWNPRAVSPRNCDGSRDLGLCQINDRNLDSFSSWYRHGRRFDPMSARDSLDVGLAHLAWLHAQFRSWTDAVVAYNGGESRVIHRNPRPSTIAYAKAVMGSEYKEAQP